MDLKIKAINFNASEELHSFIDKKLSKIVRVAERLTSADVSLKVVKPETALNKEVSIRLQLPGGELHAEKVCDTFEEGVVQCIDALQRQLEKYKDKRK